MNALKLGVIVLLLASAAGCSASTSTTDKPAGPPKNGGTYDTPADIVEALEDEGVMCDGLHEMPDAEDPAMTQKCSGHGGDVIVRVFDYPAELEAEREAFDGAGIFEGKGMLVGKNWNLLGLKSFAEAAHEKLGGKLLD